MRAALLQEELALEDIAPGQVVIDAAPVAGQTTRYIHFQPPIDAVNYGAAYARMIGVSEDWLTQEVRVGQKQRIRSGVHGASRVGMTENGGLASPAWLALGIIILGALLWLWS
jgi:hypothetical protein